MLYHIMGGILDLRITHMLNTIRNQLASQVASSNCDVAIFLLLQSKISLSMRSHTQSNSEIRENNFAETRKH